MPDKWYHSWSCSWYRPCAHGSHLRSACDYDDDDDTIRATTTTTTTTTTYRSIDRGPPYIPWKTITFGFPVACRASLSAFSTASAPLLVKKRQSNAVDGDDDDDGDDDEEDDDSDTDGWGRTGSSASASWIMGAWKPIFTCAWTTRSNCDRTASSTFGWPWPVGSVR